MSVIRILQNKPFPAGEEDRLAGEGGLSNISGRTPQTIPNYRGILPIKLQIPQANHILISRPRLLMSLDKAFQRKLTLISAPAGFGKTTMLGSWTVNHPASVAWISLDQNDNAAGRFWHYVEASLIGLIDNPPQFHPEESLERPFTIESVCANIAGLAELIGDHGILILDDFHLIQSPDILSDLVFFLDHLPANLHLIIAGRSIPSIPLARMRANGQLHELGMEDLRFLQEEASAFLHKVMGLHLSPDDLSVLTKKTEGWVAGLQLAAISIIGHSNASDIIEAFSGKDRFVLDYLMEEVLRCQPEAVRDFLFKTSILPQLTGPLCDAVLNRNDGAQMLEALEQANLFLVGLDRERRWYRYHHLFSEFLLARLEKSPPADLSDLHRRASFWFEGQSQLAEAVDHALASGDTLRALELVDQIRFDLFRGGELDRLLKWLELIPADLLLDHRPRIYLMKAYILTLKNRPEDSIACLKNVETMLDKGHIDPVHESEIPNIRGEIAMIRAMIACMYEDLVQAEILARIALDVIPKNNLYQQWAVHYAIGHALLNSGNSFKAVQSFSTAYTICQPLADDPYTSMYCLEQLAVICFVQGRLTEAVEYAQRLLEINSKKGPVFIHSSYTAHRILGMVHYQRNEMIEAAHHLEEALNFGERLSDAGVFQSTEGPQMAELLQSIKALPSTPIGLLSGRETEILSCIAGGLSNQEIAAKLFISAGTVKRHISNIFQKLEVHSRTRAVARARELGAFE